MKRALLICISVALSLAGFSQNLKQVKEYSLSEVRSSDNLEYEQYTYNRNFLLEETIILTEDGTELIDSLWYDEFNNITKLKTYQLLNGKWTHVSYIDYTYDGNGNRLTRSNYNSYGSSNFTLGGIYNYSYDENNKLTSWELLMSGTDLMQACTFTYNTDGKVILEIGQDVWNSGFMEDSWKIDYQYNTDGTMKTSAQSFWNGFWQIYGSEWFYYDNHKNCIKWDHKSGNTVTNRFEYEYNLDFTIDQFVLPVNPEDESNTESLVEKNNMLTISHWYTENDAGVLVYVCDYNYKYDIIDYTAVPNYGLNAGNMRIYPNPASDNITIIGENTMINRIDVVDNAGKIVLQKPDLNKGETKLDVTDLKSGIYYIRALTSKGMVTEKLVVQ